jgi:hypothetical protein
MPNLLEGWDTLHYYWLDDWNSSAGRRKDVSRRHRVKAGSGVHSVSYPEGTIAIFPLVTQAVSLQFEMTLTPSKAEIKNANIRTRPSGTLYVHCLLSVLMVTWAGKAMTNKSEQTTARERMRADLRRYLDSVIYAYPYMVQRMHYTVERTGSLGNVNSTSQYPYLLP